MPFHQAFTTGLSSEVIMSGDVQQTGLGQETFPAGLGCSIVINTWALHIEFYSQI